jgi:hypothetical protein
MLGEIVFTIHWFETLRSRYQDRINELTRRREILFQQTLGVDSLQLRRLEREEIMKGVLRWILGPSFRFYDEALPSGMIDLLGDLDDPGSG